jgi:hypothetical protein
MIKVFHAVEDKEQALKIAKKLGVHKIDSDRLHWLKKVSAKKSNSNGYPDAYDVILGYPYLIGVEDNVWLYFSGKDDWFKTSPILSCKETKTHFEIETQNSIYITCICT